MTKKITRFLKVLLPLGLALVLVAAGCRQEPTTPQPPTAAAPTVRITSPAAGATVAPGDLTVTIEVSNFTVQPPGGANVAGRGHIHYYMDVTIPTAPGAAAVTAPGTYQAVPSTTATWENVPAGSHTFGVQLVNNDHTPLSPPVTATVTVTVGAATTPPAAAAPTVRITSPAPGATVAPGNVAVAIEVSNFEIQPPGGANAAGKGHIHYYMDVDIPTAPGAAAVTAAGTYKAVPSTTATWENVPAGSHTFGVQLVNNDHTPLSPPVTATVTVTVGAATTPPPAPTGPSVRFTSPAPGATVAPGTVTATVDVANFLLQPPGGSNLAGYGHIHFYLDVDIPTTPGAAAVTAAGTYKAQPGTTVTWDNVAPGTHTLGVQLVNNDHTPLSPPVTATLTITAGTATGAGGGEPPPGY
jgi:hypothetical protein